MTGLVDDRLSRSRFRARLLEGVRRAGPADRAGLMDFRRSLYGPAAAQCDEAYLRWQLEANPNLGPGGPELWVAARSSEESSILGQQAAIPFVLQVGRQEHAAGWAVDLAVRPELKLHGLGAVLSERCVEAHTLTVGLAVSDEARRSYLRAGWLDLGTLPRWVRPIGVETLVRARLGQRWAPLRGAARWVDQALALTDRWDRRGLHAAGLELAPASRVGSTFDDVWRRVRRDYPVLARRGAAELRWRFEAYPDPERYRFHTLAHAGEPIGYAVLRDGRGAGVQIGHLVDFLAPPWALPALLLLAADHLRARGANAMACLHLSETARHLFPWLGFFVRDSGARLMVRPGPALPEAAREQLADRGSWFVTAADADLDHPRPDD